MKFQLVEKWEKDDEFGAAYHVISEESSRIRRLIDVAEGFLSIAGEDMGFVVQFRTDEAYHLGFKEFVFCELKEMEDRKSLEEELIYNEDMGASYRIIVSVPAGHFFYEGNDRLTVYSMDFPEWYFNDMLVMMAKKMGR